MIYLKEDSIFKEALAAGCITIGDFAKYIKSKNMCK